MGFLILCMTRCWCGIVIGSWWGAPAADDIYGFVPPRSLYFWKAAYQMQIVLDLTLPFFIVMLDQHAVVVVRITVLIVACALGAHGIRRGMLPLLRERAKHIIIWLLGHGNLQIGTVRCDSLTYTI